MATRKKAAKKRFKTASKKVKRAVFASMTNAGKLKKKNKAGKRTGAAVKKTGAVKKKSNAQLIKDLKSGDFEKQSNSYKENKSLADKFFKREQNKIKDGRVSLGFDNKVKLSNSIAKYKAATPKQKSKLRDGVKDSLKKRRVANKFGGADAKRITQSMRAFLKATR